MRTLASVPEGLDEIVETYGDCHAADFYHEYIQWFRSPVYLRLSWEPTVRIGGFLAHKDIGKVVVDIIQDLKDYGGLEFLRANDYDLWGGCFNPRGKRIGVGTSTHAWGISVDWCPALGPMGRPSRMPQFIVDAFVKRGFVHGGTWNPPDGTHFQACSGY